MSSPRDGSHAGPSAESPARRTSSPGPRRTPIMGVAPCLAWFLGHRSWSSGLDLTGSPQTLVETQRSARSQESISDSAGTSRQEVIRKPWRGRMCFLASDGFHPSLSRATGMS